MSKFAIDRIESLDGSVSVTPHELRLMVDEGGNKTLKPQLSTTAVTVNQGSYVDITITNYNDGLSYVVESLSPEVAIVSRTKDVIRITGGGVTADASATVRVNATLSGMSPSDWVNISTDVIYVPMESDETIQVVDFSTDYEYNDGWSV